MLVSLHVKNLALIEECEVFFGKGLNIMTGETGAGKSIIIGSVRLALGAPMSSLFGSKADKECIRTGAEYALVELIFETKKQEVLDRFKELDIPVEDDGTVFIQRKILPARSVCKVNGETVTNRQLRELASLLIDIHGQNDTQTLLQQKKHIQILDDFAGEKILSIKQELREKYAVYSALKRELKEALLMDSSREKELELAKFEIQEIENAGLKDGEDEELEDVYRRMNHAKKITQALSQAYQATSPDGEHTAAESVVYALREIKSVSSYDKAILEMEGQLLEIDALLDDFNRTMADYLSSLEFSQEEYIQTQERLNLCNHLKAKYGPTLCDVQKYMEKQWKKVETLSDYEGYLQSLTDKKKIAEEEVMELAMRLSKIRRDASMELGKKLEESLKELNFDKVSFLVDVSSDADHLTENGQDEVVFMISLNAGEPRKSLSLVASGGELSRIMLALKTIMADQERTETFIFDEIDAGISGKTAWKVSEKMAVLGKDHQLICITHLPQIASMADSHYAIEKIQDGKTTVTQIKELNQEEQLKEIARLLGSDTITDAGLANAKELKELANQTKNY